MGTPYVICGKNGTYVFGIRRKALKKHANANPANVDPDDTIHIFRYETTERGALAFRSMEGKMTMRSFSGPGDMDLSGCISSKEQRSWGGAKQIEGVLFHILDKNELKAADIKKLCGRCLNSIQKDHELMSLIDGEPGSIFKLAEIMEYKPREEFLGLTSTAAKGAQPMKAASRKVAPPTKTAAPTSKKGRKERLQKAFKQFSDLMQDLIDDI